MRVFLTTYDTIAFLRDELPSSNFKDAPVEDAVEHLIKGRGNVVVIETEGIGQTAAWVNCVSTYIADLPMSGKPDVTGRVERVTPAWAKRFLERTEQRSGCIPEK
jgi:hypothetical protein